MLQKEVNIPRALREIHGERSRVSTLILVYLSGLLIAGIMVWQAAALALPWWKTALLALMFLDIGGGVVANFSTSTNQHYQQNPRLRLPFIIMHVIHPLVFWLVLPTGFSYALFVMVYAIVCMLALNFIQDRELQRNLAALLTGLGICLSFLFPLSAVALYTFAPLFLVKLLLGFSVRRPLIVE